MHGGQLKLEVGNGMASYSKVEVKALQRQSSPPMDVTPGGIPRNPLDKSTAFFRVRNPED